MPPCAALTRGAATDEVTGFGRGQILQVVGSASKYVVTYAELSSGRVDFESPGQTDKEDIVECTVTSPSGAMFLLRGSFTPRV